MNINVYSGLIYEFKTLLKYYPKFILSNNVKNLNNEVPVFTYHTIDPSSFESQLRYLKDNDYKTLSINEYYKIIIGEKQIESKSVLLTIDDGRLSFWKYGYPLLKKYNMKATLFIIPGRIADSEIARKNLNDVWNRKFEFRELSDTDELDLDYCNWNEIKKMKSSNLIDIENHSLFHKPVFTETKIIDIIDSETKLSLLASYFSDNDIDKKIIKEEYIGLPIFKYSSLMEGKSSFTISNKLKKYFREQYEIQKNLGKSKQQILKIFNKNFDKNNFLSEIQYIKDEVPKNLIRDDIKKASSIIMNKIGDDSGTHFCLPYTLGSDITIDVLKEIGIKTCFWGVLENKKMNKPGDDPYYNCRIKDDFIFRLPGKGRKSLPSIYGGKIRRRLSGERVF